MYIKGLPAADAGGNPHPRSPIMLSALTLFLAIASCKPALAASAASGTFNVLSMNVAGLPEILNSNGESGDKTSNTMVIGQVCLRGCLHGYMNLCPVCCC